MDSTNFSIEFSLMTSGGYENFAKFILGDSKQFAYSVLEKLKGDKMVNDKTILQLNFTESKNGLPVNIQVLGCTLDQIAENSKMITKEIFKFFNLEEI